MQKQILFTSLIVLIGTSVLYGQQNIMHLLETPLHKTEKETIRFLTSVAGGKKPVVQSDGRYRSYSLEGPSFHIEYKIAADTCVMAGVRFAGNSGLYNKMVQFLMATTRPFGENRLKQIGNLKLIYILHAGEGTITTIDYEYALKSVQKQPFL